MSARRAGNGAALGQRFRQQVPGEHAELIKRITQPTLILWGSEDHLVLPTNAERFAKDVADSRLVMFDGLGHVPQEEDPQATVAAMRIFLDDGAHARN